MFRFKKKLHLNEMAKASEGRMIDRLPPARQAIYLTGKALEKLGDNARLNGYKQFIVGNGMDWDAYKNAITEADLSFPTENTTWTASRNGFASEFHNRYNRLYANMKRMIEVSKDDIDRQYVDKIKSYYNKVRNEHIDPTEAFEQVGLQSAIDWIRDDPGEAEERFGSFWPVVQRHLSRWLDGDYENSLSNLMDQFWDWRRANQRNPDNQTPLDTELATKLANKLATNVAEFGQYYNFILTTVVSTLGVANIPHNLASKLAHDYVDNGEEGARGIYGNMYARVKKFVQELFDIDTESEALPTAEEVEAFDARGNGETAAPPVDRRNGYERYVAESDLPADLKQVAANLIENTENANTELFTGNAGAIDRDQVRAVYAYTNTINREHHHGRTAIFNETSLQEFYDKYKPLFLAGFYTAVINYILKTYAENKIRALADEDRDYWNTTETAADGDFNENYNCRMKARKMFEQREMDYFEKMEKYGGGDVAYELSELIDDADFNIEHKNYDNGNFWITITSVEYPDFADMLINGNGQKIKSACIHQIVNDEDKEINIDTTNINELSDIVYNYVGTDITDIDQL